HAIRRIMNLAEETQDYSLLNGTADLCLKYSCLKEFLDLHVFLNKKLQEFLETKKQVYHRISKSSKKRHRRSEFIRDKLIREKKEIDGLVAQVTECRNQINPEKVFEAIKKTLELIEIAPKLKKISLIHEINKAYQIFESELFEKFFLLLHDHVTSSKMHFLFKYMILGPAVLKPKITLSTMKNEIIKKIFRVKSPKDRIKIVFGRSHSDLNEDYRLMLQDLILNLAGRDVINSAEELSLQLSLSPKLTREIQTLIRDYRKNSEDLIKKSYKIKFQYLKKIMYLYHDGKPITYSARFSTFYGSNKYSTTVKTIFISPKPRNPFERFLREKIGFDASHPDYCRKEDYIHNFPILKDIYDAREILNIWNYWRKEDLEVSVIFSNEQVKSDVNIILESDLNEFCLIEWDLSNEPVNGLFLVQYGDLIMIPDEKAPLTKKIMPFDLLLCEKSPVEIKNGLATMRPVKKIAFEMLFEVIQKNLPIFSSCLPLKKLQSLFRVYNQIRVPETTNVSKKSDDQARSIQFFKLLGEIKEDLLNLFHPNKPKFLQLFNKHVSNMIVNDKEKFFSILKDFPVGHEFEKFILTLSNFDKYKKIFIDTNLQSVKHRPQVSAIFENRIEVSLDIKKRDHDLTQKVQKADIYHGGQILKYFIIKNFRKHEKFSDFRRELLKFIEKRLKMLEAHPFGHLLIDVDQLSMHPIFEKHVSFFVKKRMEELFKVKIKAIATETTEEQPNRSSKICKYDIGQFYNTHYGYLICKNVLVDYDGTDLVSSEEIKQIRETINTYGIPININNLIHP
ncbi:MAG: hypothetical protein ACTSRB_17160, partial [Candidatus Helarchaeota archaeon]